MLEVKLFDLDHELDLPLTRVVLVAKYKNQYIFVKHKERDTWELPGGHIEDGETWEEAAKRELYEETGCTDAEIKSICYYKISTYGLLCIANINTLEKLNDDYEIESIKLFDTLPDNLTYQEAHTLLFNKVKDEE